MGSFSQFRKAENRYKPGSPNEKFNVTNDPVLSLLREFWRNNYAHVILTAEADSLPTDEKELLDDYGLVRCHSSRSNDLSVVNQMMTENGHAAIFEVKFGKKTEQPQNRASDRLNSSLTVWSLLR